MCIQHDLHTTIESLIKNKKLNIYLFLDHCYTPKLIDMKLQKQKYIRQNLKIFMKIYPNMILTIFHQIISFIHFIPFRALVHQSYCYAIVSSQHPLFGIIVLPPSFKTHYFNLGLIDLLDVDGRNVHVTKITSQQDCKNIEDYINTTGVGVGVPDKFQKNTIEYYDYLDVIMDSYLETS